MPLLDHFNPPLNRTHPWRSFHSAWAAAIARWLNQDVLPEGYYAVPLAEHDGPIDFSAADDVEVQVFAAGDNPRLVAAVELVSPRTKDRPQSRQAFAMKCNGYLQQGISIAVVDTVTTQWTDLNNLILSLRGARSGAGMLPSSLSAMSYDIIKLDDGTQKLVLWPVPLALGEALPIFLPLHIDDILLRLDLEASYQATCADLRIRPAG